LFYEINLFKPVGFDKLGFQTLMQDFGAAWKEQGLCWHSQPEMVTLTGKFDTTEMSRM